jgi:hypothetical protein
MQLQLVRATRETRQLDDIVSAFTPPMRRVCPHLADAALREMIERMALQQLADEQQRRSAIPRRAAYASFRISPGTSSSSSRAR